MGNTSRHVFLFLYYCRILSSILIFLHYFDSTVGFQVIKTTEMTQPASFYVHTDESSTQPASVVSINH